MIVLHLVLVLVLYVITTHFFNKVRNLPPSPFPTLPILGHLYLLKKPIHRSLSTISSQYGPVVLLQFGCRRVVVVSSPSAAEECFTKNDVVFANRPLLLAGKYLGYNFRSLAWAPYGDYWRNLRRISSQEILSSQRLLFLSHIRSEEVELLIRRLVKAQGEPVNMKTLLFELMLNVMMRMIAGKRYYGDNMEDSEEGREFQAIVKETFVLLIESTMADFLPMLATLGGLKKRLIQLHRKRDRLVQNLIENHRKRLGTARNSSSDEINRTMIQVLLSLQDSDPENYKDDDIKSLMIVLLAAGTDTSASTLEWAMSNLLNNVEILAKAQAEMDDVIGNQRLVEESDLGKLSYLHSIIRETMRMFPAAPLLVPHESRSECRVGGYRVPSGTMLLVNMWGIQRDPSIWEEPTRFRPERFEGVEEGERDGFRLMPFGSGRRGCPGEGLAMRIVGLVLGSLLQCFEWERVGEEMVDLTEAGGLTMCKSQPLLAKCTPRPCMMKLLSQV